MHELLFEPITTLAELIRTGKISSKELVQASLERIETVQPLLNAFVYVDAERALQAAAEVGKNDGRPFAGVPLAVKDTAQVTNMPFTMGSELFGDFVSPHDSFAVKRLREAGFILLGKTNMPEFGILPVSESQRFGPTRNPWNTDLTPGGSSGGSAAAVAAGVTPIAHANDGGGSIRIPAACCGLVGLKPTRGRISRGPEQGEDLLVQDGVLTRTVAETAVMLDLLAGYETGDASWAPPPPEPFSAAVERDPGQLRIGMTAKGPLAGEPAKENSVALKEAADLLTSLGHDVCEIDPPWAESQELLRLFTVLFGTQVSLAIAFAGIATGRTPSAELVEPLSWEIWKTIGQGTAVDYLLARTQLSAFAREVVVNLCKEYDIIMTPTLAERPVAIGELDGSASDPWRGFERAAQFTPYTAICNVTGQPAISLPLFQGEDGLPSAVHFIGRPADEATLLSLASQLERERPWAGRRPPQFS